MFQSQGFDVSEILDLEEIDPKRINRRTDIVKKNSEEHKKEKVEVIKEEKEEIINDDIEII